MSVQSLGPARAAPQPSQVSVEALARAASEALPGTASEEEAHSDEEPSGVLSREAILEGIEALKPLAKQCYEQTLKDFPEADGRIVLAFTISAESGAGRVQMSELGDATTLHDAALHDCLLVNVGDLEFEAPQGGGVINVRYPFDFAPQAN
ncbi:MAG: AgmX/PglI C-terminal domain-containing protein [Bradymonadaceae bacterium]|nr:AgmX/PglI C-terminal domain-containing protein [Lujinxingiaceae bacterium]